jgi:exodeoxyribonuclease VII large subunit
LTGPGNRVILLAMSQLPLFQTATWSVVDLTRYLRQILEGDLRLQDLWVKGEVSNCSRPSSGHLYFTLKDAGASLRCVMWRTQVTRSAFIPRDGDAVEVHGSIGLYESTGVYQLYADRIIPDGEGFLFQEFVRLKARLEAEGLFSPERKKPVPRWPQQIGVVTSPSGAAWRDILNVIRRRCPHLTVVLAPTQVQGEEAPAGIAAALQSIETWAAPDVVLLARGGGSIEDLWAFNHESVARAVARCRAPVITGIGHETDFTIADFVADLRAPTPTAAAELATPDRYEILAELEEVCRRLKAAGRSILAEPRWSMEQIQRRLSFASPKSRMRSNRQTLDELGRRSAAAMKYDLRLRRTRLAGLAHRLASLDPTAVLKRGFAVLHGPDGEVIKSVNQVQPGWMINARLSDGAFDAKVIDSEGDE